MLKKILVFLVAVVGCTALVEAQVDPRWIGKHYYDGVVKVILYDDELVDDFNLKDEQGQLARGSGFFVTEDGVVFTNRHVVEWCVYGYIIADWSDDSGTKHRLDILTYQPGIEKDSHIEKIYYAGHATPVIQVFNELEEDKYSLYLAEVVGFGENFDGAIVRVVSDMKGGAVKKKFEALPLGDSNDLVLGEELVVLGFPEQYDASDLKLDLRDTITLSKGTNSGWDYVFDEEYGMIKTDAAIHEGNSGGPVFGDQNKVIGIATALGLQTQIGLVGPINCMYWVAKADKKVFDQLVALGLRPAKRGNPVKVVPGKPQQLPKMDFFNPITHKKVTEPVAEPTGKPSLPHFPNY